MTRYFIFALLLLSTPARAELAVSVGCDGPLLHGPYEARSAQGVLRITGRYASGEKDGIFTFYSAEGVALIELPYARDRLDGTVRAWQHAADAAQAKRPKLVSDIRNGFIEGRYQTWYSNGAKRSDFIVEEGDIRSGTVWNPDGEVIEINASANFLQNDIDGDFAYYSRLEQLLETYRPECQGG